jgi:hypothetical protein
VVIQHWILGFLEHGTERLENRDATLLGPIERRLPLAVACVPYQRRMKKAIKRAQPYCDSEIPSPATPHPTGKIGHLSALRIPIHVGEDKKKFVGSQMGRRPPCDRAACRRCDMGLQHKRRHNSDTGIQRLIADF